MLVSMTAFWVVIQELLDVIQPASLVEIGSDQGECTQKLCGWARPRQAHIHVIETHPTEKLKKIVNQYQLAQLHVGMSLEILPVLPEKASCFIVDGDHNYYTVSNELKLIAQHNTPDLILLHDVCWPWGRRDIYYALETIPEEHRRDPVLDPDAGILPGNPGIFPEKGFHSKGQFAFARAEGGPQNGVMTAIQDFLNEDPRYELFTVECVFGLGVLIPKSSPHYARLVDILTPYVNNPLIKLLEQDRLQSFVHSFNRSQPVPNAAVPKADKGNTPSLFLVQQCPKRTKSTHPACFDFSRKGLSKDRL